MTENRLFDDGAANPIPGLGLSINNETATGSVVETVYSGQSPTVAIVNKKLRDSVAWEINGDANTRIADCVNVGDYEISATVTRTGYDPTTVTGTLRITPKQLTVSGTTVSNKVYDGTTDATIFRGYVSGLIDASSVICFASGSFPDAKVGDYNVSVIFGLGSSNPELIDNYIVPAPVEISASILPKQLTAPQATAEDKIFDGSDDAQVSIGELVGIIAGEDVSATATGHFEDSEPGEDKVVNVDYILSGADAENYTIESESVRASITPDPNSRTVSWSGIKYRSRKVA